VLVFIPLRKVGEPEQMKLRAVDVVCAVLVLLTSTLAVVSVSTAQAFASVKKSLAGSLLGWDSM
jgi:hypothetical protein